MNITYNYNELNIIAGRIKNFIEEKKVKVCTFYGDLGAGKTTLIKNILCQYGICESITSPTFSYVNRYENKERVVFYHFDLYRLSCIDDFMQAGFTDFLFQEGAICFIEWPEVIDDLLDENALSILLKHKGIDERIINIEFLRKNI